jgi:hypothetical protein
MEKTEKQKLVAEAFLLGFMCSREGFNGECAFQHCADGLRPEHPTTESEFREMMVANVAFKELEDEAIQRLAS